MSALIAKDRPMDRAEGALLVAEKALSAVRALAALVAELKSSAPSSSALAQIVSSELAKALSELPLPRDGKDGASVKGDPGEDGRDGRDGEPGRDAVHIDVLDGIDPQRKYQRGTYAVFRGGMVRSRRVTDPMPEDGNLDKCGWQVVVRGIDDIELDVAQDMRTVTHRVRMTDGGVIEKTVKSPALVYRGIWREGTYERGDCVTRDGSTWHANAGTTGQPGTSEDWQLCVKRGNAGRDGLRGEKGASGVDGRPGRDMNQIALLGGAVR